MVVLYFNNLYFLKNLTRCLKQVSLIFFLLLYYEGFDYISTGVSSFFFFKKLNLALLNGVLNIHPWLIFLLYSVLLFLILFLKNLKHSNPAYWNFTFLILKNKFWLISLSVISILLGSFWAFQELSWGGWWNWDIVELISLNFFFISLLIAHSSNNTQLASKKTTLNLKLILVFLISVVIVRFNLISSIHAFVNPDLIKLSFFKLFFIFLFYSLGVFFLLGLRGVFVFPKFVTFGYSPSLFFNILLSSVVCYVFAYVSYLMFLNSDKIDLNYFIEIIFVISYFYFILFFHKSRGLNYSWAFNFIPINYMIFLPILQLKFFLPPFGSKKNLKKHFYLNRLHTIVFIVFCLVYFFKIYYASFAIMDEVQLLSATKVDSTYMYASNFVVEEKNSTLISNFFFRDLDIFYNFELKQFNFNREVVSQYYRNFLFYFLNSFFKFLSPGGSAVFLVYTNLFICFCMFLIFFLVYRSVKVLRVV